MSSAERSQRIEQVIDGLGIRSLYGNQSDRDIRRVLNGFSDSTLEVLIVVSQRQQVTPNMGSFSVLMTSDETKVREYMHLVPNGLGNVSTDQLLDMINGLHFTAHFRGGRRLEELTGDQLRVAQAFLTVTAALYERSAGTFLNYHGSEGGENDALYVFDKELHDLIVAHFDKASEIAHCIGERATEDPETIREYLNNETVLRDGAL